MNKGILHTATAYTLWGLLPVYWKAIQKVPAAEILCHRMVWSLAFILILLGLRNHWNWLKKGVKNRRTLVTFLGTACLLAVNWLTYIWAVNSGYIVETSLGYFINPLISVLLGVVFLRERLRPWQWIAISVAACGVLYLTVGCGTFPWIGLILAFTFGFYGLLRKTASLNALEGLSLEMAILFLPALTYLLFIESTGTAAFGHVGLKTSILLAFAGVITAFPLLLFASGARKITLIHVGLLQYISPTFQFMLGVFVYHEPFTATRWAGFSIIWAALFIYTLEGIVKRKRVRFNL